MRRARAALARLGDLRHVRAEPAPVLSRGVHRAPWHFHGDDVHVVVDHEGVCRAEAIGMDNQACAFLWAELGDRSGERTLRRLTQAQERRFQKFYRAGTIEREIRRLRRAQATATA